ncbi:hypothetical protein TGFOU_315100 [Toxoplasma gondii FOU]|uniref:Uncharacterized protein n=2 Tax=Toxoplasma gondii TaxID=5811 RepID=A0A086LI27_TOXGO|nr:hypothetical protein TGFOU_315100 [Toxoplasma gondii FOU]PUA86571.1 hypothetical protein TGBR9_315100 [Toxoplasma gondii TgCATBr9]
MAAELSDVPEACDDAACQSADPGCGSIPGGLPEFRASHVASADVDEDPHRSSIHSTEVLTKDDGRKKPPPTRCRLLHTVSSDSSTHRFGGGRPATAPSVTSKDADANGNPTALRRRNKEILRAKKARKDKHFSKIAFTSSDSNYYNLLPVQPGLGWWKCILMNSNHSLSFAYRLARNLDVAIPDTVFCSGTESFYICSGSKGMPGTLDRSALKQDQSSGAPSASSGWIIKSDFSAVKLLESNLFSRIHAEEQAIWAGNSLQLAPATRRSSAAGTWNSPEKSEQSDCRQFGSLSGGRAIQQQEGVGLQAQLPDSPPYPAAVMKQMHYSRKDCNITKAIDLTTLGSVSSDSSVDRIYQAFVRGKSRSRCQLTRVCWSASRAPSGFTLVNRLTPQQARSLGGDMTSQFCVSCDNPTLNGVSKTAEEEQLRKADPAETSFDVFPVAGATLAAAAQVAKSIFHFTQTLFKVWLETIVVDLVKGSPAGRWYFIQVKSFTVRQTSPSMPVTFSSSAAEDGDENEDDPGDRRKKSCCETISRLAIPSICQMCGLKHRKQDLNKTVNLRMMLETQHHMRKRGLDILFFPLSGRLQLSYNYPVCSLCYSLYLAERELIKVELDLAQALRQPIPHRDPTFFSFTGVLDAIQSSTQADDPYLMDLLRSFNNAPPRQAVSFEAQGEGDNGRSSINLQLDRAKDRDPLLAFVNTHCDTRRSVVIPSAQTCHSRSSVSFSPPSPSSETPASSSAVSPTTSAQVQGGSPSFPYDTTSQHCYPSASHDSKATVGSSAGATSRDKSPQSQAPPRHRMLTGGAPAVAPPKQTLRGGEAVMGGSLTKEDRCRQLPPKLYQWRMMLFVHSLQDLSDHMLLAPEEKSVSDDGHPADGSGRTRMHPGPQVAIELKLFGSTTVFPLHTPERQGRTNQSYPPGRRMLCSFSQAMDESGSSSEESCPADPTTDDAAGARYHCISIRRILVLYLFSVSPTLHRVFQEESIHFRLLASGPRAPTDRSESRRSTSGSAATSNRLCPSTSTSRSRTSGGPPVLAVCPECSNPCPRSSGSFPPAVARRIDFGPSSRLTAAEITGQRPYSAATAPVSASVCPACKFAQPRLEASSPSVGRCTRPRTAAAAPSFGRHGSCGSLPPGSSGKNSRRAGLHRTSSASSLTRTAQASAEREGDAVELQEVASGSCSLQRLVGVKHSKQQSYVLLFAAKGKGQARLRLVLGLHQDMQVPSQYVCVRQYADAFLPARPYSSPCPVPSDWLDCLAGSGGPGTVSSSKLIDASGSRCRSEYQKQGSCLRVKAGWPSTGPASSSQVFSGNPAPNSNRVLGIPVATMNPRANRVGTETGQTPSGRPVSAEASISAAKRPLLGLRFSLPSGASGRPTGAGSRPQKAINRLQMGGNAPAVRGISPIFMLDLES